jgi:hypothetical protein
MNPIRNTALNNGYSNAAISNLSVKIKKNVNFTNSQTRKETCIIRTIFNYLNLQIRILIDLLKD